MWWSGSGLVVARARALVVELRWSGNGFMVARARPLCGSSFAAAVLRQTGFHPVWYSSVPDCPPKNILSVVPYSTIQLVCNSSKKNLFLQTLECKKCLFSPLKMMAFRYHAFCPLLSLGDAFPEYEEASPVLKVTGGSFHHHHFGGELFAWVVYKMGIVRYKCSRAHTRTHNTQHITTG